MSSSLVKAGILAGVVAALTASASVPATAAPEVAPAPATKVTAGPASKLPAADQGLGGEIEHLRDRFGPRLSRVSAAAHQTFKPKDGVFVDLDGDIYRVVGGAPLYVSSWKAVGGRQPALEVTERQFFDLRMWPLDGTFVTASDGRSYRFVGGAPIYISTWKGFGGPKPGLRIDAVALADVGDYDEGHYGAVNPFPFDFDIDVLGDLPDEEPDDDVFTFDMDGTLYIRGAQTNRVYKIVGGAPLYVADWKLYGGPKPAITVDQVAIDRAEQAGPWQHLLKRPTGMRFVRGIQTGQAYSLAGGAPVYVANPKVLRTTVTDEVGTFTLAILPARVDQRVIDRAGTAAPYDNLRWTPQDGTLLISLTDHPFAVDETPTYLVQDGAASLVDPDTEGSELPEFTAFGYADQRAIDRAGQPGVWSHLNSPPT